MAIELMIPRAKIIVPKLKSYVKLDMAFSVGEGTKLFDKSRYRSHGTIVGADWSTGLHGTCLDFVAASKDYVTIPASYTQLNFTSESFSIIARCNFDLLNETKRIFVRGLLSEDGFELAVETTGKLFFRTNQSGAYQYTYSTTPAVTTGAWYTIGLSRNGATGAWFVNGVDLTSSTGSHINPATCSRVALLGARDALDSQFFDGKMEFLRIFGGVALSASEHLAYHNALA